MGLSKWGRWLPLVLLMSCNAKLQVGEQGGGGAGAPVDLAQEAQVDLAQEAQVDKAQDTVAS